MKKLLLVLGLLLVTNQSFATHEVQNLTSDQALAKLKEGNNNYVAMKMKHPNVTVERREEMVKGQNPFVAILSCSDSRVPTEILFDQGLGDIFVIRNAGNIVNNDVMGSVEYAVYHLGVKLVVVMGHQSCGAVGAAMSDKKESKYIEEIKKSIEPAVSKCKCQNKLSYDEVIKENAKNSISEILKNKPLAEYMKEHNVKIVEAYYDLNTGKVTFYN